MHSKRILYIDHKTDTSEVILSGLQASGYEVVFHDQLGPEVLAIAREARQRGLPFHAVISHLLPKNTEDLNYKECLNTGAKILARLRAQENIPLVYYTGWGEAYTFAHTGYFHCDSVFIKSLKPQADLPELLQGLKYLLEASRIHDYGIIPPRCFHLLNMVEVPAQDACESFLISRYPVSLAVYQQHFSGMLEDINAEAYRTYTATVAKNISWYDAVAFCNWISKPADTAYDLDFYERNIGTGMDVIPEHPNSKWDSKTAKHSAKGYRLPTQAEFYHAWESGCIEAYNPACYKKEGQVPYANEWLEDVQEDNFPNVPSSSDPDDAMWQKRSARAPRRKQISWQENTAVPGGLKPYDWHNTACYRDPQGSFRLVRSLGKGSV